MVHAILHRLQRRPVQDPVEPPDRALAMEAGTAIEQREMACEFLQAAATGSPFVEIAGQQRGPHFLRRPRQLGDRPCLQDAPQAGQVQMHAEHRQFRPCGKPHGGGDHTTRFPDKGYG